jgi:hypothetical protein
MFFERIIMPTNPGIFGHSFLSDLENNTPSELPAPTKIKCVLCDKGNKLLGRRIIEGKELIICCECINTNLIRCHLCNNLNFFPSANIQRIVNNGNAHYFCNHCAEELPTCPTCQNKLFTGLRSCRAVDSAGHVVIIQECRDCFKYKLIANCHHCGDSWLSSSLNSETSLCPTCQLDVFECSICHSKLHNSNLHLDENTGEAFTCCNQCYRSVFDTELHGHAWKPEQFIKFEISNEPLNTIHYGTELEVNGSTSRISSVISRMNSDLKKHAYIKRDGSISSGGFEIVTQPHTLKANKVLWKRYFENPVKNLTSYKTGECGFHVHIERRNLTEGQIRKMMVFLNAPENLTFIEKVAQRPSNRYTKIVKKSAVDQMSDDRYEALNTTNIDTIELRIFRGSYRADRILKNIEFADALVNFSSETGYADLTSEKFSIYIDNKRKQYPYLYSFLTGNPLLEEEV